MASSSHLALVPLCGACEDVISLREYTISVIVDRGSSRAMTRPFPFPPPDLPTNKVNGFVLCRNAACEPCAVAPECLPRCCHGQPSRTPRYLAVKDTTFEMATATFSIAHG
ncbi:hypothetical protein F5883DRAFT_125520 [Diaporthe sp. PMI_573]|nr:hypothetical protein F5883DRAFT_125520 [Diaporthaceae sp. PMI_573]